MFENAITTAKQQSDAAIDHLGLVAEEQAQEDAAQISTLTQAVANLKGMLATDDAIITALRSHFFSARDLQKRMDWDAPKTGTGIGANPASMVLSWNADGNLVMTTTGTPGKYCDALTAIHLPGAITPASRELFTDFTLVLDDNQAVVQCHEFDSIFTHLNGTTKYKDNGSLQIDDSRGGMLNIGKGGGGWADTPVSLGRLTPGRHTIRAEYFLDQKANVLVFVAVTFDGTRYGLGIVQPATVTDWMSWKAHLQLQEDINSKGGTTVTVVEQAGLSILS